MPAWSERVRRNRYPKVLLTRSELGPLRSPAETPASQALPDNTRVYPDLVRHLCGARDLETTHAFTPILFDIYVLRETERMPENTRVYPDLVRHLCAARDLENAREHTRLPRSCSTSMCCERLRECPRTHAFTPILFDIYVLRETQRMPENTRVYPDLVRHVLRDT